MAHIDVMDGDLCTSISLVCGDQIIVKNHDVF